MYSTATTCVCVCVWLQELKKNDTDYEFINFDEFLHIMSVVEFFFGLLAQGKYGRDFSSWSRMYGSVECLEVLVLYATYNIVCSCSIYFLRDLKVLSQVMRHYVRILFDSGRNEQT